MEKQMSGKEKERKSKGKEIMMIRKKENKMGGT